MNISIYLSLFIRGAGGAGGAGAAGAPGGKETPPRFVKIRTVTKICYVKRCVLQSFLLVKA